MSTHKSLKGKGFSKHRNVLKKTERIKLLEEEGKWKEGQSAYGLCKVRSIKMRKKKAVKEEEEAKPEWVKSENKT